MMKLGMKPVTGVSRITIKRAKNVRNCAAAANNLFIRMEDRINVFSESRVFQILFVVSKPHDVFKSPTLESYVIFGEAKIEDLSSQLQAQAAQQFRMQDLSKVMSKPDAAAAAPADEEEEVDETGIEPRDIDLVMTQASSSSPPPYRRHRRHRVIRRRVVVACPSVSSSPPPRRRRRVARRLLLSRLTLVVSSAAGRLAHRTKEKSV